MANGIASSANENQQDVMNLREAITHSDELFWLRFGPEVFRWVILTGAAAASCLPQRAWFIARVFPFAVMLEPEEVDAFMVGVDHLLSLFNHRDSR
jgi:hypothetical protein